MSEVVRSPIVVVGIGADGWDGLAPTSRAEVERAEVLMGSGRQLDLVPPSVTAERVPWPSPMTEALPGLFETYGDRAVVVLASGDPMFSGIGTTLTRLLGAERVRVLPAPCSLRTLRSAPAPRRPGSGSRPVRSRR